MAITQLTPTATTGRRYGSFAGKELAVVIPTAGPSLLLAADRQDTWAPMWVLESLVLPERYYGTRDCAVPVAAGGNPFLVGESEVGGDDLVGGGAGSVDRPAHGAIIEDLVVTRGLVDVLGGQVETPDVEVLLANGDGRLQGDYRGATILLWRYDAVSRLVVATFPFVIAQSGPGRQRGTYGLRLSTYDRAILETEIPKGLITTAEFPLAVDVGMSAPWVFGNVVNLPLPCVRDDQIRSQFDYLLCRGEAAALTGLRRVTPGSPTPFIEFGIVPGVNGFDELEPYPGMDAFANLGLEDWDAGVTAVPTSWAFSTGTTPTVAKNTTAGQFSEGSASASVTCSSAGAVTRLTKNLMLDTPQLSLSWWRGREVTVAMDGRAVDAARVRCEIDDGVAVVTSGAHTGGGTYEPMTVPFVINAAATKLDISFRISSGAIITAQLDNVRVYLRAKSWNECLRTDLYPGYTAIRTLLRQEDSSGSLFTLAADVHGLQPERNPVRAVRTILSDATHGLGKTVDATTFDAEEAAISLTHEDVLNLDGPELFLPFRDTFDAAQAQTFVIKDRSGHARHGLYDKGAAAIHNFAAGPGISPSGDYNDACLRTQGDGDWIAVPDAPAFSTQSPAIHLTVLFPNLAASATDRPLVEKLIGAGTLSGYGFYRASNTDVTWFVRGADTNLYTVSITLNPSTDEDVWMELHGEAEGGVLRLYRDDVLTATGSYTGAIAEGAGEVLIAKFGTGGAGGAAIDSFDNVTLFSHALAVSRIAAHTAAIALLVESVPSYDRAIVALSQTFNYRLTEDAGALTMADASGVSGGGAWTGTPTLGVAPSVLNGERGFVNSGSAARFENNAAKYGVKTGLTLNNPAATLDLFYRPVGVGIVSGLVEKCIGTGAAALRDTQWGVCQRSDGIRLTLIHAGGTLTLVAPVLAEDVGRAMWLRATWASGAAQLYKNGALAAEGTYTAPVASGVGDFLVGIQGTNGSVRTRPCSGDLGRISYAPVASTAADTAALWLAATWYPGGLTVDVAFRAPRQAQEAIAQLCLMRGLRLGVTATGAWTIAADQPATTLRCEARDGVGAGERTLIAITERERTPLEAAVSEVVVEGRVDPLSGLPLVTRTRTVGTRGKPRTFRFDVAREWPALDRIAGTLRARLALDETVKVRLTQEARQLREGELVLVTDAERGYTGESLQATSVGLGLEDVASTLREYDEDELFTYAPEAFPSGAAPG